VKTWLIAVIVTFIDIAAAAYFLLQGNTAVGVAMLLGAGFGFALVYQLARRGR
jgi:hypothetical protein